MSDLIIKRENFNFHFLGAEVLEKCPQGKSQDFEEGYLLYVEDFFNTLDLYASILLLDHGYSRVPLDLSMESPVDEFKRKIGKLGPKQKADFIAGFELGMQESCDTIFKKMSA